MSFDCSFKTNSLSNTFQSQEKQEVEKGKKDRCEEDIKTIAQSKIPVPQIQCQIIKQQSLTLDEKIDALLKGATLGTKKAMHSHRVDFDWSEKNIDNVKKLLKWSFATKRWGVIFKYLYHNYKENPTDLKALFLYENFIKPDSPFSLVLGDKDISKDKLIALRKEFSAKTENPFIANLFRSFSNIIIKKDEEILIDEKGLHRRFSAKDRFDEVELVNSPDAAVDVADFVTSPRAFKEMKMEDGLEELENFCNEAKKAGFSWPK